MSSIDASIFAGPFSRRTSSAFFNKLGGNPTGRSRASRADGKLRLRKYLFNAMKIEKNGDGNSIHPEA
jgi:hypothetical protein